MPNRTITIKLEHLPEKELNPNNLRRLHWTERSRISRIARDEIGWLAKAYWGEQTPMMKARISYLFLIKDRRKHDVDNLLASCKPFADGLIDASVLFSDDLEHLEYGEARAVHSDRNETIITLKEI